MVPALPMQGDLAYDVAYEHVYKDGLPTPRPIPFYI